MLTIISIAILAFAEAHWLAYAGLVMPVLADLVITSNIAKQVDEKAAMSVSEVAEYNKKLIAQTNELELH